MTALRHEDCEAEVFDLARWGDEAPEGEQRNAVLGGISFHDEDELLTIDITSPLGDKRLLTSTETFVGALREAGIVP